MPKPKTPKPTQVKPTMESKPVILVTDLDAIQKQHAEPIGAVINVGGQPYRFEGRRLRPEEDREIAELLQSALPKRIPATEPGKPDAYDYADPEYQKSKSSYERQARALAIWKGFPVFRAEYNKQPSANPNPDRGEIQKFIESREMPDEVLEGLYGALTVSLVSVQEYTGFISGSSSPKG